MKLKKQLRKQKKNQKRNQMNKPHFLYILFLALFTASCSNTRYLPEGELLYTGAKIKIEGNETSNKENKALKTG